MEISRKRLANGNLIEFGIMAGVYALSVWLPFSSRGLGALSYLFIPADVVMGISAAIFGLLALFCGYTLLAAVRGDSGQGVFIERIGPWFAVSCILNIAWMMAFYYGQVPVSAAVAGLLALSLAFIYYRLKIGASAARGLEKCFVHAPIRLYLGWTAVLALANTAALLDYLGASVFGLGGQLWAILAVLSAVAVALFMLVKRGDIWFSCVVALALAGVFVRKLTLAPLPDHLLTAAGAGAVMVAGAVVYLLAAGFTRGTPARRFTTK
jgi:hypothetical protein